MRDRQTSTVWSHLEGIALRGPLAGSRMELFPLVHATWEQWRGLHPDTLVLSEDTPWQGSYRESRIGRPGLSNTFIRSLLNWDSRLPEETLVLGVEVDGTQVAYPLKLLAAMGTVVNDEVAGLPVVAWYSPEAVSAAAYSRVVDGEAIEFLPLPPDHFQDTKTGSTWDLQGLAVAGPLAGNQLRFVPSFITEWYGWAAFHPDTTVYNYEQAKRLIGTGRSEPRDRRR